MRATKYATWMIGKALIFLTIIGLVSTSQANPGNRLGINVSPLHKLTSSDPFIDIFKVSRGWVTSCEFNWQQNRAIDPGCTKQTAFNTNESHLVSLDRNGWVTRLPSRNERPTFTTVNSIWDMPPNFPLGDYFVTYEGDGEISVHGNITVKQQRPGRIDFTMKEAKGLRIHLKSVNPRNYIRNIKVIPKKYESIYRTQQFNPEYIRTIRPFNSLRFMPWQNTKDTQLAHWNERTTPANAHYNNNAGLPVETMIDLANTINAAPWFSMPHKATNGFMVNFARTVKQRLKPGQKVYVEYSNEVWNMMYPATNYASREGLRLWPNAYPKLNSGSRKMKLALNYLGKRTREMCDIWKREFGGQRNRVVCVLSSYAGGPTLGEEALSCPLVGGGACSKSIDAYAVGPYFGDYIARIENRNLLRNWSRSGGAGMNNLFTEIMRGGLVRDQYPGGAMERLTALRIKPNVALARKHGLKLLAYEGGQHLLRVDRPHTIKDERIFEFFAKANQNPRMGQAYSKYLRTWRNQGGGLLMHFNGIATINNHSYFGMLDNVEQHSSPKYNALINFLRGR
ncbi:MAG TPA: hypothetical protein EYG68_01865 [Leucothrix mucor]|nr:hypothetical protein [Leucothrix mucor]